MRELFDARLNPDDKPMTQAQLAEAVKIADVLVPTVTDRIDAGVLSKAGEQLKLIANFGNGVDNIDVDAPTAARHHRHQYAGRADRRHRRHDDGADPGGAAPARRRRAVLTARQGLGRLVADLDARASHLGQAARHHRHGPHRPGGGAARPRLRPADPLSQPPQARRRRSRQKLDATYWESLDQMLARMDIVSVNCPHTPGDLSPAVGAAAEAAAAGSFHRQHGARRSDRRERAGADARSRRHRRRRPRRVRARAGGQSEAGQARQEPARSCCCRTWARRRSKAASTWARR